MTVLEKIVANKVAEVSLNKELRPTKLLERSIFFQTNVVSMREYLLREDKVGIIAEIKRSAPSLGDLNIQVDVEELSIGYMQAGATALSVLTDQSFFGGSNEDLTTARKYNYCPILRKDFVLDEYQIVEAKSIGADCVLLIARCLTPQQCRELAAFAQSLNLEVLLEVHTREELETHLNPGVDLVGVNNRNLHDLSTSLEPSLELASAIPDQFVKVSESGISQAEQIRQLKAHGYRGFLIGSFFMQHALPGRACKNLIDELQLAPV